VSSEIHRTCHECGTVASSSLPKREIVIDLPSGGYDTVPVPLCRACIGQMFGFECPNCGIRHDSRDDARYCCQRAPGEAPDCRECGRRMERGAWGSHADGRPTVEWAECEACGVSWGRFTGWHDAE